MADPRDYRRIADRFAVLLWTASRARAVLIEPFQVPPPLAERGLSGEVVASRLLDEINTLQERTSTTRPADSFANNWDNNLNLAIPDTGMSVGDLWRLLRHWLGSETRIAGDVVRDGSGGATVTIRLANAAPFVVSGPESDIDRLMREAALKVFEKTQPFRYAVYLGQNGREAEAIEAARKLATSGPLEERRWGHVALGNLASESDFYAALEHLRLGALQLPDVPMPNGNLAGRYLHLGQPEEALRWQRLSMRAARRHPENISDGWRAYIVAADRAQLGLLLGDFRTADRGGQDAVPVAPPGWSSEGHFYSALARLGMHDISGSRRAHRQFLMASDPGERPFAAASRELFFAYELDDRSGMEKWLKEVRSLNDVEDRKAAFPNSAQGVYSQRNFSASVVRVLAKLARFDEAAAIAARMPLDCYQCVLARAELEDRRGNLAQAQRWANEAIRQAPSIPVAYDLRGRILARHGKEAPALASYATAVQKGPGWADPQKHWGDLLASQGQHRAAERKYRAAAERAPRWGALHVDWGISLWRLGRRDEAREKWRAAAAMDLSARDRGRLQRIWTAANE